MSSLTIVAHRVALAVTACAALALPPQTREPTHVIDAAQSKLEILVGKSGFLSAFGHGHVIDATHLSGTVVFDERDPAQDAVTFVVTSSSLRVTDPGTSAADREKVQSTMLGPMVLDAAQFPEITFTSTAASPAAGAKAGAVDLDVAGVLRLHGVERPIHVRVQLHVDGATLRGHGEVTIKQTDFGMTPVTAAGGTVKVKDPVRITFDIVAAPRAGGLVRLTSGRPR